MTRVTVVVFDAGETLLDETRLWSKAADDAGVRRFTFTAFLGELGELPEVLPS